MSSILQKLHMIMTETNYIQKDKKNKFHGYTYASELAIKTSLHESLVKHKVLFQLETANSKIVDLEPAKDGKSPKMTTIDCVYTFHDVESEETFSGEFTASGPARDDKGLWAATTNAIKYILTSTFLIPTGDDAESDNNHPPRQDANAKTPPPAKQSDKPEATLKSICWDNFQILCVNKRIAIPDRSLMPKIIKEICDSKEVADAALEHEQEMPIPTMGPNDRGWELLSTILITYDIAGAIDRAVIEKGKE